MAAEQQLDRAVLERKERDELVAIAQAMSLKPGSRSRKSQIIDVILGATPDGAGSDGAAATGNGSHGNGTAARPPARAGASARTRKAASATIDAADALEPAQQPTANGDGPAAAGDGGVRTEPAEADRERSDAMPDDGSKATDGAGDDRRTQTSTTSSTTQRHGQTVTQAAHGGRGRGGQFQVAEAGNRRGGSRRRRGRGDRNDRGERDLQGRGETQDAQYQGEPVPVSGLLDLRDEGYGFLRTNGYLPGSRDVYVSISQARRFALRKGDYIEGASRPAASNEKFPALLRIDSVSGMSPDEARERSRFEDLTPLFPDSRLRLEVPGDPANMTARIVDLLSPIGKGQRGLIVSPPKAGKTTIMKQIAHSIETNNPEVHLMVLLVDERPEEVTDMRRSVQGEVVASTFDRPAEEHTIVAELAIERARRLVEMGRDVVIILDGITRLARAYNLAQPATGRIMSGGVDSGALYPPKKFFGAARNIEEGGSLTILATALVETGSKMDEVIFEEFKGTGNMELRLDRRLAERRLYPSIDVNASSTRHEELLFERGQLQQVWKLRRVLNALAAEGSAAAGLELLMDRIRTTRSNDEFLAEIAKGPAPPA